MHSDTHCWKRHCAPRSPPDRHDMPVPGGRATVSLYPRASFFARLRTPSITGHAVPEPAMNRLTDLIVQARQGRRIHEMLPIEGPTAPAQTNDTLHPRLEELDDLLLEITPVRVSEGQVRRLISELDAIADTLVGLGNT